MIRYAIKIEINGHVYRFAEEGMRLDEGDDEFDYIPYILNLSPPSYSTSLTPSFEVPSAKVSVWDGNRELIEIFSANPYESATCILYTINDSGVAEDWAAGYITDMDFEATTASFTIRMDERSQPKVVTPEFTPDSFQHFEYLTPVGAKVAPDWSVHEDMGWQIYDRQIAHVKVRSARERILYAPGQPWDGLTIGWVVIEKTEPGPAFFNYYKKTISDVITKTVGGTSYTGRWIEQEEKPLFEASGGTAVFSYVSNSPGHAGQVLEEEVEYWSVKTEGGENAIILKDGLPIGSFGPGTQIRPHKNSSGARRNIKEFVFVNAAAVPAKWIDAQQSLFWQRRLGYITSGKILTDPINGREYTTFYRHGDLRYFGDEVYDEEGDVEPVKMQNLLEIHIVTSTKVDTDMAGNTAVLDMNLPGLERYYLDADITYGDPIRSADFRFGLQELKTFIPNMTPALVQALTASSQGAENRLKGLRIDMLGGEDDVDIAQGGLDPGLSLADLNQQRLGSVSRKFAVATGSEAVPFDNNLFFVEQIKFSTAQFDGYRYYIDVDESGEPPIFSDELLFTNNMFYTSSYTDPDALIASYGSEASFRDAAIKYFTSQRYRVVHAPVPENQQDLGKRFPVAIGFQELVPMRQVISTKAMDADRGSAGDDVYIYAAQECGVRKTDDIQVFILNEKGEPLTRQEQTIGMDVTTLKDIVESPFPVVSSKHWYKDGERYIKMRAFYDPYYVLENPRTLDNLKTYGIRLMGGEWNPEVGARDARYPIRNGVGSTTLYASYMGAIDKTGEITGRAGSPIVHPVDAIRYYVRLVSQGRPGDLVIDVASANAVKALTPRYASSCFIEEEMTAIEFVEAVCKQFGLLFFMYRGKVYLSAGVDGALDDRLLIADGHNIVESVKEVSEGYKQLASSIVYHHTWSHAVQKYKHRVVRDSSNNRHCASAAKAHGGSEPFEIDGRFCRRTDIATDVANRYAKLLSRRRIKYQMEIKNFDDNRIAPGTLVPFRCRRLFGGMRELLVTSVTEERYTTKIEGFCFID